MELLHTESKYKGEEHPKGAHRTMPAGPHSFAQCCGEVPTAAGSERGRRCPTALLGWRKPAVQLLSSPASSTKELWVQDSLGQPLYSTGSREPRGSGVCTWAVLSQAPDPSCPQWYSWELCGCFNPSHCISSSNIDNHL